MLKIALLAVFLPFSAQALEVVASFSILGDMVKEVGGDKVNVHTLVGPNSDAHVYQPTPADAKAVGKAQLLVVNGLGFEGWINRLVKSAGYKGKQVVASQGVDPLRMVHEGHKHHNDPHAWQSLKNALIYVENITRGLTEADPANASFYQANKERYLREIKALDAEIMAEFQAIPKEKRKLVTSHDAFGYFAKAYEVQFLAPKGISTEAEAGAGDVAKLIKQIKKEQIKAVFMENIADDRLLEQIARESGAKIGGNLFSDALSDTNGPASTYLKMMRHNSQTLLQGLQ